MSETDGCVNRRMSLVLAIAAIIMVATRAAVLVGDMRPIEIVWVRFVSAVYTPLLAMGLVLTMYARGERLHWSHVNLWLAGLCVAGVVTNIVNNPPSTFLCWQRLGFFVALIFIVSPLVVTRELNELRQRLWRYTLVAFRWMIVLNPLLWQLWDFGGGIVNYSCFFFDNHTSLGIVAGIVTIDALYRLADGGAPGRWEKVWLWFVIMLALAQIMIAGSVMVTAALVVALLPLLWRYRRRRAVVVGVITAVMVAAAALVAVPGIKDRAFKKVGSIFEVGLAGSRTELWENRLAEFEESPVIGIGFGANTHYSKEFSHIPDGGQLTESVEPGSSWLSLAACTGVVGTLLFVGFFVGVMRRWVRCLRAGLSTGNGADGVLSSVFLFLVINMFSEGWLLFAGSAISYIFWLSAGCLVAREYDYTDKQER